LALKLFAKVLTNQRMRIQLPGMMRNTRLIERLSQSEVDDFRGQGASLL
jgi:hypothetical protein